MRTVLILGATGTQGGAVCRHLSAGGETQILAITRDATSDKAQQTAKLARSVGAAGESAAFEHARLLTC